eukprot:9859102-Heterocapsa_arctica.AAC.1
MLCEMSLGDAVPVPTEMERLRSLSSRRWSSNRSSRLGRMSALRFMALPPARSRSQRSFFVG